MALADNLFDAFYGSDNQQEKGSDDDDKNDPTKLRLVEDLKLHFLSAMEYYYHINMPLHGLLFYKGYKDCFLDENNEDAQETEAEVKRLVVKIAEKQITAYLQQSIIDRDFENGFHGLMTKLK